ncbi:6-phospho-3-hexuloisomerase [Cedecea sp. NFIX57]|uniref:6-phospho-3-hexuloisomerase n=1 Tax=Cedecea sp. NFIX57 TaxID=1566286 RepID=UPI000A0B86A3|nr:6-phospho-3-hexuloisomerase [Cedecea sp. NFIX57]SMG49254.1 6-phospho-3-hexuloisomerase [Cedecea sp. NFIX57]
MTNLAKIVKEITALQQAIDETQLQALVEEIKPASHIFLAGAGRSGLMINAFANRLMHLGFSVSVIGEISSPHSKPGDLMIVGSGSGETQRLVNQAKIARQNQVRLALITCSAGSTLEQLADCVVTLPAGAGSEQPMGTLFEQASLLVYDSIVLTLMNDLGESGPGMKRRHADIE